MKRLVFLLLFSVLAWSQRSTAPALPEAPTGFDTATNGLVDQSVMDFAQDQFAEDTTIDEGLGPTYNARACADCHDNTVIGGTSQVSEHRIKEDASLIHDKAIDAALQQTAPPGTHSELRMSISIMGDAFVEAVSDADLIALAQKNGGQFIMVPTLNVATGLPSTSHVGRFGWKDQHATLFDFAADAAFNEVGHGNQGFPDPTGGVEDAEPDCSGGGEDIDCYTDFMRGLKAPPRGPITNQVQAGQDVFRQIGCASCHVPTLKTTGLAGGDVQFHPFGDYLLHDVGTGDGVAQGPAPSNKVRTAPLWGLRTRPRLLHDGSVFSVRNAVGKHRNEAGRAANNFSALSQSDRQALLAFLGSL